MAARRVPLCVMAAVLIHVAAQQEEPRYARLSGQLHLLPDVPPGTDISGLLWKHGPYKVVEWDRGTETDHYGTFEGRTTLDLSTGNLVINSLTRADSGVYSIELNNNLQPKTYKVFIIDSVSKPIVSWRPPTCGPHLSSCLLSCDRDATGAEPVTYSWRTDEGDWKDFQKDNLPNITNDEELCTVKTFSCKLKNPVSEEQSDPKESPFYCPPGDGYGWIAIVVLAVLAAAGGVVAYLKRGEIQKLIEDRRMRIGDAHQPPDQRDTLLINHTPATDPPHTSPDSGAGMAMRPSSTEMLPAASTEIIDETNTTSSGVVKETDTPEAEVTKETTLREGGEGPQPSTNHDESTGPGESLKGEENI